MNPKHTNKIYQIHTITIKYLFMSFFCNIFCFNIKCQYFFKDINRQSFVILKKYLKGFKNLDRNYELLPCQKHNWSSRQITVINKGCLLLYAISFQDTASHGFLQLPFLGLSNSYTITTHSLSSFSHPFSQMCSVGYLLFHPAFNMYCVLNFPTLLFSLCARNLSSFFF